MQDHPRVRRPRLHGRRQHERAGARRCDSPAGPSVGGRWDPSVTRGGVCRALHRSGWSSPDRSARTCATSTCTRRSASRTAAAAPVSARSASSRCAAVRASAQAAPLVNTQGVLRLPQRVGAGRAALRFAAVVAHGRAWAGARNSACAVYAACMGSIGTACRAAPRRRPFAIGRSPVIARGPRASTRSTRRRGWQDLAPFAPGHPVIPCGGAKAIGAVSAAPFGSASILPISWMCALRPAAAAPCEYSEYPV